MPLPANFDDIPQTLRNLEPRLLTSITGRILGFSSQEATTDPVVARVVRAAMIGCYCYAPTAPDEIFLEASARLSGWLLGVRPHTKSAAQARC